MVARTQLFTFLTFLAILSVPLLAHAAAAETWCVRPIGADYTCFAESAYNGTGQFSNWCLSEGGSITTEPDDARCEQVCCCRSEEDSAYDPAPVSRAYCQGYGTNQYTTQAAQDDCDVTCGGAGGSSGATYNVSGHVYDLGSGTPVQLQGARVEYPLNARLMTVYTDDNGVYTLYGVPTGQTAFRASLTGCGDNRTTRSVTANINDLDFDLNCVTGGCTAESVNDTLAEPVRGQAAVTVTWTPSSCTNIRGHLISRCEASQGSCNSDELPVGYVGPTDGTFIDTNVPTGKSYCYFVESINTTGGTVAQAPIADDGNCILPMDKYCTTHDGSASACFNSNPDVAPTGADGQSVSPFTGAAHCDAGNRLQIDEQCGGGTFCYITSTGGTGCRAPDDCEQCNGVLGWFLDAAARVTGGPTCAQLAGCVLNNQQFAADTFEPCTGITSCADYRTSTACEAGTTTDTCKVSSQGCTWIDAPGISELGKGACVPKNVADGAACDACDAIYGFCNATLCSSLGSTCYYDAAADVDGEMSGCVSKDEMACRYYDTQQDCTGGTAVSVDVTYDNVTSVDGNRTGGTNDVTVESQDALGFGKCAWVTDDSETGGHCVKDANGRIVAIPWLDDRKEDDCLEQEGATFPAGVGIAGCFHDTTPPTTELPFADGDYIDAEALRESVPIVHDDTFPPEEIMTWFCLVNAGGSCYPRTRIDNLVADTIEPRSYTLYYYSEDPAGNLERVRHITLNIAEDSNAHLVEARLLS